MPPVAAGCTLKSPPWRNIEIHMRFLRFIARTFIDTFGITHPAPENEDRIAWFIGAMLLGILAIMASALLIAFHYLHA